MVTLRTDDFANQEIWRGMIDTLAEGDKAEYDKMNSEGVTIITEAIILE